MKKIFSMHAKQKNRRRIWLRRTGNALLLGVGLMLSACSKGPAVPENVAETSADQGLASRLHKAAVARGKIEVEGGLVDMAVASNGTVLQLPVQEGEVVAAGTVLLRLDDSVGEKMLGVATAEVRLAREKLRAAEGRVPALRTSEARYTQAAREGASSGQLADTARQHLADAQADVAVAQAELAVAAQRQEMARAVQAQRVLTAPAAGTVVSVLTQLGSFVQAGVPVLTLLPDRPLIVRAELNAAYVDAVRVGMQATVVADLDGTDDDSSGFKAKVVRISPMYGHGRLQEDAQRGPVRVVECVLAFDHAPKARVGQNVRVIFHE